VRHALNLVDGGTESIVGLDASRDGLVGVNDGRVISTSEALTDGRE
jgi:hypothetical protein